MANAALTAQLLVSLAALIQLQEDQINIWVASGKPPTFSLDGESYSWGTWLAEIDAAITAKIEQRQKVSGSWIVRTTGRA